MNIHAMPRAYAATAARRRFEIANLVRERNVRSQDELARLLAQRGIAVTQPTLSRDLKDLAVLKSPAGYALPGPGAAPALDAAPTRFARLLKEFAISVAPAGSLVVVKTPPGAANAVAQAADQSALPDVVGTLAGDDTIFFASQSASAAARLARELGALVSGGRPARRRPR